MATVGPWAVGPENVSRLKLLKDTRAFIGSRGFDTVLNELATPSSQDFMEATSWLRLRDAVNC